MRLIRIYKTTVRKLHFLETPAKKLEKQKFEQMLLEPKYST